MIVLCLAGLLTACDWGLAYRGGHVGNRSRQDLVIEIVGASEPHRIELPAQSGGQLSAPAGRCLGTGVALYTPDGELLTTLDEPICDGRSIRIEDDDLPPRSP